MFERILAFFNGSVPEKDSNHIRQAKQVNKIAQEDHEEVIELIQMLEVQNRLNHYSDLVESALRARRGDK